LFQHILFVTQNFIDKNTQDFEDIAKKSGVKEYYVITDAINKSFSELDNPSGIAAVYTRPKEKLDLDSRIIYLNDINDPGNMGAILRSAIAFDFRNIVLDETCADIYNTKTINAAKDSIFKLNISRDKNFSILKKIKKKMPVYTTRLEDGEDITNLKSNKTFCLVFGNEARGISSEIKNISDQFIKIKMKGDIESLNVAISASIIFYELSR